MGLRDSLEAQLAMVGKKSPSKPKKAKAAAAKSPSKRDAVKAELRAELQKLGVSAPGLNSVGDLRKELALRKKELKAAEPKPKKAKAAAAKSPSKRDAKKEQLR